MKKLIIALVVILALGCTTGQKIVTNAPGPQSGPEDHGTTISAETQPVK